MITGRTRLIAHLGYPTEGFKAPMIYNPWFAARGIDAVVVPMGVTATTYAEVLPALFKLTNIHGALVTMPHKMTTAGLVDELSVAARIAGACNAILRRPDGSLLGDMFDGDGFVRGLLRKGCNPAGLRALVVGSGGVGSAIAASLAAAGLARIDLFDTAPATAAALGTRLRHAYPALAVSTGTADPRGCDILVNATPLGMREGDGLPVDIDLIPPSCFVGEVVMREQFTPLLRAARARGCRVQPGVDMLYEMIPAYLEFFGFGSATPEELQRVAALVD